MELQELLVEADELCKKLSEKDKHCTFFIHGIPEEQIDKKRFKIYDKEQNHYSSDDLWGVCIFPDVTN